jgi:hypothetical protein
MQTTKFKMKQDVSRGTKNGKPEVSARMDGRKVDCTEGESQQGIQTRVVSSLQLP